MSAALLEHATHTIAVGSKSFAAAARLFAPEVRRSVLMLYAWCRHCDDVVDGQELGFTAVTQDAGAAADARSDVLAAARAAHPERFTTTDDPKILAISNTAWINKPTDNTDIELAA